MAAFEPLDFDALDDDVGQTLAAALRKRVGGSWSAVRAQIERGRVSLDGRVECDGARRLERVGQRVSVGGAQGASVAPSVPDATREAPAGAKGAGLGLDDDRVLLCDAHLLLVDKPSGVSTVPFDEGERGALSDRARAYLRRRANAGPNPSLFVVHRIDRDTSGVVAFARTWLAQRHLAGLFRAHALERRYLGLVRGHLARERQTVDSFLLADRGDGRRGSARGRFPDAHGQRAITHLRVRAYLRDATLVEAQLETGRTHQVRIHLAELGHPLFGDDVYGPRRDEAQRLDGALRLAPSLRPRRSMLHAALLAFSHPVERLGEVRRAASVPDDFAALARALGALDEDLTPSSEPLAPPRAAPDER